MLTLELAFAGRLEMQSAGTRNWEHVDSVVDRRIDSQRNHVWPFGSSFPVDVRFLILDRRQEVPLHRPDHLEVVVFESGELGYEVENNICTLAKDDVVIVGNHIHHRCLALSSSRRLPRTIVLSFLPVTVHSGIPLSDDLQYLMPFSLTGLTVSNVIRANSGLTREIRELIDRIRQELPGATERSRLTIRTYLKVILLILTNHCTATSTGRAAFNRQKDAAARLLGAFEHVQEHYDEPIRIAEVARLCAASTCRFMSLFKEVTGQSFVGYLNRFRVAKARDLLANTNKTISEIGLETGFCNQSYFGVVFRRVTGKTPLEYRLLSSNAVLSEPLKLQ
jgi:AraC-like DNA-binding protein/quercetin dioxygenase-like cupin family protein